MSVCGFTLFSICLKKPVLWWQFPSTLNLLLSLTWGTSSVETLRDLDLEFFGLDHLHKSSAMSRSLILLVLLTAFKELHFPFMPVTLMPGTWFFLLDILHASCNYKSYNPIECYSVSNRVWWLQGWCASNSYNYHKLNHWWSLMFFSWWLVDRASRYNLGWSPTWCTKFLFTCNTFIVILYMFQALPCSSLEGLRLNCIYAASGIVTLCRWLLSAPVKKELQFFLNRCTRQSACNNSAPTGQIYMTLDIWWSLENLARKLVLTFWHRSFIFNSNQSPTWCKSFSVYYPDVCLQLNMFRAFSRPSSGAQWLQRQLLVLPSYHGDSRAV